MESPPSFLLHQRRGAAPSLGAHNEEIWQVQLGLTDVELAALKGDVVIK